MTIKQNGGVFGRNPTFNDVTIEGDLILNGETFTGLDFNGSWNANSNSPTLSSGTGTQGEFYIVSVAGTTNLDGVTNWGVGDYCFFNGTAWQRIEGGADGNFATLTTTGNATIGGNLEVQGADFTITANVKHASDLDTFFGFHANNQFRVVTGNSERIEVSNSGIIVNDSSENADFRIESNNNTHMFFVDGGTDSVSVGTTATDAALNVNSGSNSKDGIRVVGSGGNNFIAGYGNQGNLSFSISETGADDPSVLKFFRNGTESISITADDADTTVFNAQTDNIDFRVASSNKTHMLFIDASEDRVGIVEGTPESQLHIKQTSDIGTGNTQGLMIESGTSNIFSVFDTDGTFQAHTPLQWNNAAVFNEGSQDYDFRIESDSNTHAFFVDAGNSRVGIMHNSPSKTFDVQGTGRFGIGVSQNTEVLLDAYDNTTNSDIAGLVGGSTFGALIQGGFAGHCVVGLRENDVGDSFSIVSGGGNFTTDSTYDLLCFQVESDGDVSIPNGNLIVKDSGIVGTFNRLSSDGLVLKIEKDNAAIGGLGAAASSIYLQGSSNGGIYINGQTDVRPWNTSTLANLDNSMDLGSSTARFKDLYLSNNLILNSVKLGGGSATVADDAVGSFTPPKKAGIAIICPGAESAFPAGQSFTAMFYYDVGTSLSATELSIGIGGDVAVTSGDVTGTTGTDGDITIGLAADTVKVENRIGGALNIQLTFL